MKGFCYEPSSLYGFFALFYLFYNVSSDAFIRRKEKDWEDADGNGLPENISKA